ncbi:MAG: hypothetical protein WBC85_13290, partial [Planktotalea sp.]|uniref:hypothetical protein n=1 Tax=Planktotalea sp. TaxID=2029877 RepID=UPI003C713E7E
MDWLTAVLAFLEANTEEAGAVAAVTAILGYLGIKRPFSKKEELSLDAKTIEQLKPVGPVATAALTVPQFIAIRREMKADLEQELSEAHDTEKAELRARIAEMETQIADPEPALADAQKTIAELTDRLTRMGNDIGGDRLAGAQAAFAKLDYSVADDIFARVEESEKLKVQKTSHAAYARGEIAENEIRWLDAAEHYQRAALLDPSFDALFKARELSWRTGNYEMAVQFGENLVALARRGRQQQNLSLALNEHATTLATLNQHGKASELFREALLIDEKTIGNRHPN